MMYDTIIIGAGMAGLAAGIRLAYYNQRVCILERHTTIGGLNSFYRLRGRDYDVGLHALTNFTPRGTRKGPLARLLRQLRFRWDDFCLAPQVGSAVRFPGVQIRFNNDIEFLRSEVARAFPAQQDPFEKLLAAIVDYDDLEPETFAQSARQRVGQIISDPLLREMIFCPLMWYGNAREDDMDFGQFCIMFRSIFLEGLARPLAGVRLILKNLVRRFRELGGELKLRAGVQRLHVRDGRVSDVSLDDGTQLSARHVLSTAGWVETMRMCDDRQVATEDHPGRLSFTESIAVLNCEPPTIGHQETIVFYNDSPQFHWRRPDTLCDMRTGVVCSPNNFIYPEVAADRQKHLPHGVIRVTSLANYETWMGLDEETYRLQKLRQFDSAMASAVRFVPDFRAKIIDADMFTPKTIQRFTGHVNGAVYGAPGKRLDGRTHLDNLHVCGTDQGYVGIIGTIVSGISIANRLLPATGQEG